MSPPLILLVDDDPEALDILNRLLEIIIQHAEIVMVKSSTAALAVTAKRAPRLVITDYRMPNMNGVRLARAVKAVSPTTRVAIITAEDRDEVERLARSAVAEYVVSKSFMLTELQRIVEESLPSGGAL